jgi:hypothetical protein
MPVHNHTVNDPGHGHGMYDPGHGHGISDPGHGHTLQNVGSVQAGSDNGGAMSSVSTGYSSGRGQNPTNNSSTNIGIYAANTGQSVYGSGTGIWLSNAGGNAAIDVRPAYTAILFIMKA